MKPLSLSLAAITVLCGFAAHAAPIRVISGEHREFTRLVLELPPGSEWLLEGDNGQRSLILENHIEGFDIRNTFDIIPRTRLATLVASPSTLELRLGCDCPVIPFVERDRYLVLDIFDGPTIRETEKEVASSALPVSNFGFGELLWPNDWTRASGTTEPTNLNGGEQNIEAEEDVNFREADLVQMTQEHLLEAFSKAASRGLLELREDIPLDDSETEPLPQAEIFDSSNRVVTPIDPVVGNIRVTDSRDIELENVRERLSITGSACPDESRVTVQNWGSEAPFSEQIGSLNERLFDELGRVEKQVVLQTARLYLYFGFGAEARRTLELAPDLMSSQPELIDLSNIFEYGYSQNPRILHQFAACDSDFALWSTLAARELPLEYVVNAQAAIRALKRLPSHLQLILSKDLSKRLLSRGDLENAKIAERIGSNSEPEYKEVPNLIAAQTAEVDGNIGRSLEELQNIIKENTSEAPVAVSELVNMLVENGRPVPADLALLAEAFAFETRGTDIEENSYMTYVTAATASGQFDKAVEALVSSKDVLSEQMRAQASSFFLKELSEKSEDSVFILQYFKKYGEIEEVSEIESRLDVADRLFRLGFFDEVESILSRISSSHVSTKKMELKGKTLIARGEFTEGAELLSNVPGPEAARWRGEALERLGKNSEAAEVFRSANLAARATSNLWLSDNWLAFFNERTPAYGAFANLANQDVRIVSKNDEMINNSRDVINSSEQARSLLSNGLASFPMSE